MFRSRSRRKWRRPRRRAAENRRVRFGGDVVADPQWRADEICLIGIIEIEFANIDSEAEALKARHPPVSHALGVLGKQNRESAPITGVKKVKVGLHLKSSIGFRKGPPCDAARIRNSTVAVGQVSSVVIVSGGIVDLADSGIARNLDRIVRPRHALGITGVDHVAEAEGLVFMGGIDGANKNRDLQLLRQSGITAFLQRSIEVAPIEVGE